MSKMNDVVVRCGEALNEEMGIDDLEFCMNFVTEYEDLDFWMNYLKAKERA